MFRSRTNIFSLIPIALLIIVVFLVYAETLRYEFVWDDEDLIQKNPRITRLDNFFPLFEIEPFYADYYRPLVSVSLAFDYQLWGLQPFGYHLSNLLFHLGSVLLIYFICLTFLPRWSSFLVALVFGLHPIHTEGVAWISGRSDVLCTLFFLASFFFFIRFVQSRVNTKRVGLYVLSCIFFFFSLLTKEMAVTLPLCLLLWWFLLSDKTGEKRWREILLLQIPFILLLSIYLYWRLSLVGHWLYSDTKFEFLFLGLETTIWIILKYLQLLFLPLKLNALYTILRYSRGLDAVAFLSLGAVLLASILFFIYAERKKRRIVAFGVGWFLITLLPVANLIPTALIVLAERYIYLPSLGYLLIFGWLLGGLLSKTILPSRSILRLVSIIALVGLMLFYTGKTIQRNRAWANNYSLGHSLLESDVASVVGHHYLGMEYVEKGENEKAKKEFLTVLKLQPKMRGAHYNLGILYYQEGRIEQAKEEFKKETEIDPGNEKAYYNLGIIYTNSGQIDSAIQTLQKVVEINPDFLSALESLAVLYETIGLLEKALPLWEKALKLERDSTLIPHIMERIKNIEALLQRQSK